MAGALSQGRAVANLAVRVAYLCGIDCRLDRLNSFYLPKYLASAFS
jgi:hypothetical protein